MCDNFHFNIQFIFCFNFQSEALLYKMLISLHCRKMIKAQVCDNLDLHIQITPKKELFLEQYVVLRYNIFLTANY